MFLKQLVLAFADLVVSERARKPITCYEGGKKLPSLHQSSPFSGYSLLGKLLLSPFCRKIEKIIAISAIEDVDVLECNTMKIDR